MKRYSLLCLVLLFQGPAVADVTGSVMVGLGYDDNPSLIENGAEGSSAWKLQPSLFASHRIDSRYFLSLNGGVTAYRTRKDSEFITPPDPSFNPIEVQTKSSNTTWLGGTVRTLHSRDYSFSLSLNATDYDDRNYDSADYQTLSIKPGLSYKWREGQRFVINAGYLGLEYQDRPVYVGADDMRSDKEGWLEGGYWHRWGGKFASAFYIGTRKRNSNSAADESSAGFGRISNWYAFSRDIKLINHINHSTEDFEGTIPFDTEKRSDQRSSVVLSLHYPLWGMRQSVDFVYDKLETNLYGYSYVRNVVFLNTYIDIGG